MQELTAEALIEELEPHITSQLSETDSDLREIVVADALYGIQYIADFRDTDENLSKELRHFIEQYLFNKEELDYDEETYKGYSEDEAVDAFYSAQEIAGRYLDETYGRHDYIVV